MVKGISGRSIAVLNVQPLSDRGIESGQTFKHETGDVGWGSYRNHSELSVLSRKSDERTRPTSTYVNVGGVGEIFEAVERPGGMVVDQRATEGYRYRQLCADWSQQVVEQEGRRVLEAGVMGWSRISQR